MTFIKSTEEAVAFGKHANPQQIKVLRVLRNFYLQAAKTFPRDSIKNLETALFFATKGQFMREALEAAQQPLN